MAAVVAQASCSSSSSGLGVGGSIPGLSAQNFQRFSSSRGNSSLVCFHRGNFSLFCESRAWPRQQRVHVECRCGRDENPEENLPPDSENADDSWDRRIESILLGIRGPLLMFLSRAGRKFQRYMLETRARRIKVKSPEVVEEGQVPKLDSEWERWQSVFHDVEEQENLLAVLKFDLEEAIDQEDYTRAARIKKEMTEIRSNFAAAQLMDELKIALDEERYDDASRIRDETGAGLVGWWAGAAEEGNDPFGRIINITSSQGRLVARGFSAKQLVHAGPGVPLFEVYFRKTEDNAYESQAVYLQRERTDSSASPAASASDEKSDESEADESESKTEDKSPESSSSNKDSLDEGLNKILSFLKGRMPDVKLRVFQPDKPEDDLPKIGDQLKPTEDTKKDEELVGSSSDDGKTPLDSQLQEKAAQGKNAATAEELVEMSVRMLIGRLMQNAPEDKLTLLPVRVPAKIVRKDRDSFCFHIEELFEEKPAPPNDPSSWKLAVTAQPSELTTENASKMLSNLPVKVSKEVADIIRLAVNYAQRRRGLAKNTEFRRIQLRANTDPFNALYVGTLAPYSSQVIQLRQKHGNWQLDDETPDGDKFEFTEYVEAVKLVGDLHVPAGQIIFRAKTGRGCRLPHRGIYPEELGVVARYRGRGKVAEPGFKNPHWIDGELLILDGKGVGFLNGAQLCFVYSVPGQPYLILFKRAMIEE